MTWLWMRRLGSEVICADLWGLSDVDISAMLWTHWSMCGQITGSLGSLQLAPLDAQSCWDKTSFRETYSYLKSHTKYCLTPASISSLIAAFTSSGAQHISTACLASVAISRLLNSHIFLANSQSCRIHVSSMYAGSSLPMAIRIPASNRRRILGKISSTGW